MRKKYLLVILFLFLSGVMSPLAHADSSPQKPSNQGDTAKPSLNDKLFTPDHPYKHPLWGDTSPYLRVLVEHYKIDKTPIQSIGQDLTDPLDIHPTLFLAKAASLNPMKLLEQRKQDDSWMAIIRQYNINPVLLYTFLDNVKPPPEFDHAYAQRDKLAKDPKYKVNLYDSEVRDLLGLKFCVEALAIPPQELFNRLSWDVDIEDIIVETVYNNAGKAVPPSLLHIH